MLGKLYIFIFPKLSLDKSNFLSLDCLKYIIVSQCPDTIFISFEKDSWVSLSVIGFMDISPNLSEINKKYFWADSSTSIIDVIFLFP